MFMTHACIQLVTHTSSISFYAFNSNSMIYINVPYTRYMNEKYHNMTHKIHEGLTILT